MYYYINGKLSRLTPEYAVIDCNGVGYYLIITAVTYEYLAKKYIKDASGNFSDENALLYTYYKVSEDAAELYGFSSEDECKTFKLLISVSGVGPKAAISILSALTPSEFALACRYDDAGAISKANGVGVKTAQKIIIELKDKISKLALYDAETKEDTPAVTSHRSSGIADEAISALLVLGYTKNEATKAVNSVGRTDSVEETIRKALQKLMK